MYTDDNSLADCLSWFNVQWTDIDQGMTSTVPKRDRYRAFMIKKIQCFYLNHTLQIPSYSHLVNYPYFVGGEKTTFSSAKFKNKNRKHAFHIELGIWYHEMKWNIIPWTKDEKLRQNPQGFETTRHRHLNHFTKWKRHSRMRFWKCQLPNSTGVQPAIFSSNSIVRFP